MLVIVYRSKNASLFIECVQLAVYELSFEYICIYLRVLRLYCTVAFDALSFSLCLSIFGIILLNVSISLSVFLSFNILSKAQPNWT